LSCGAPSKTMRTALWEPATYQWSCLLLSSTLPSTEKQPRYCLIDLQNVCKSQSHFRIQHKVSNIWHKASSMLEATAWRREFWGTTVVETPLESSLTESYWETKTLIKLVLGCMDSMLGLVEVEVQDPNSTLLFKSSRKGLICLIWTTARRWKSLESLIYFTLEHRVRCL
jgi:hypothetical protein